MHLLGVIVRTLTKDKREQFFRIHKNLMLFTNKSYAISKHFKTIDDLKQVLSPEHKDHFKMIYSKLYVSKNLDAFCKENPFQLDQEDLVIADSWRNMYSGEGYIYRHLADYTVILFHDSDDTARLYGVKSLTDDLESFFPNESLPIITNITLLPFGDNIVYDSFLQPYRVQFGGNIKRSLRNAYAKAKSMYGIYTQYQYGDNFSEPPISASLKEQITYGVKEASKCNVFPRNLLQYAEQKNERALFELTYSKEYVKNTKYWLKNNGDIPAMYYGLYRESVISVMPTRKGVIEFCNTHYPDISDCITIFKG